MSYFFLSLLLVVSCSQRPAVKSENFPILDGHAHFSSERFSQYNQPTRQILKEYEEAGVVGGVMHFSKTENKKLTLNRATPLVWASCAGLHPGDTVSEVDKGIQQGRYQCIKVYLGYVPKWANDPFYRGFYKLAEKHQIPVVFHTGDTYDKFAKVKYADPLQIDEIAVEYPKVKFVIAHLGNPWFNSAAEVIYKNDNVYGDVSGLILGDVSEMSEEELNELIIKPLKWFYAYIENPKKLFFGSDWPLVKLKPYIALMKRIIPEKDWEGFFYQNVKQIFRFIGQEPSTKPGNPDRN